MEHIAEPIANIERQIRRQRIRSAKLKERSRRDDAKSVEPEATSETGVTKQAAHDVLQPHSKYLIESQNEIQKIVADHTTRLELVNERVADIVSHLTALERIVAEETEQHNESRTKAEASNEEIVRLQKQLMELVASAQQPKEMPVGTQPDVWRDQVQKQLTDLQSSSQILTELKAALECALQQNKELSQEWENRWQTIEEVVRRPIVLPPSMTVSEQLPAGQTPSEYTSAKYTASIPSTEPSNSFDSSLEYSSAAYEQTPTTYSAPETYRASSEPNNSIASEAEAYTSQDSQDYAHTPLPAWWQEDGVQSPSQPAPTSPTGHSEFGPVEAESLDKTQSDPLTDAYAHAVFDSDGGRPADLPYNPVDCVLPDAVRQPTPIDYPANESAVATKEEQFLYGGDLGYGSGASQPNMASAAGTSEDSTYPPYALESQYQNEFSTNDPVQATGYGAQVPSDPLAQDPYFERNYFQSGLEQGSLDQVVPRLADVPSAETGLNDYSSLNSEPASEIDEDDAVAKWLKSNVRNIGAIDEPLDTGSMPKDSEYAQSAFSSESLAIENDVPVSDEALPAGFEFGKVFGSFAGSNPENQYTDEEYSPLAPQAYSAPESLAQDDLHSPEDDQLSDHSDSQLPDIFRAVHPADYAPAAIAPSAYDDADTSRESHQAKPASHSSSESGEEDDSVEDYMRKLLARMRGVSESEVKLPGIDPQPAKVEKPQVTRKAPEPVVAAPSSTTVVPPAPDTWSEPFDPETYVPRVTAPEKNRDLNALRELANNSARSAIQVSARRRHGTAILIKTCVAAVGLFAGVAIVSINGFQPNIALIATGASFLVAAIWGYDAIATLRPLLQSSRRSSTTRDSNPS